MNTLRFSVDENTATLSEQDAKRYFSTVGFAVFALAAVNFAMQYLLSFLAVRFLPETIWRHYLFSFALSMIPLYGVAFPVCFSILRRLPVVRPLKQSMRPGQWIGGLCSVFAAMVAGNYISQFLISWIEMMSKTTQVNPVEQITSGTPWYVNLIFLAVLAPVLEELVFRKVLCDRLLPLGEGYAVILSAAAFGLCHGNFFQFFYAFGIGCLLALIYVKTGNIFHTMLYHGIINLLGGVFATWLTEKLNMELFYDVLDASMNGSGLDLSALGGQLPYLILLMVYSYFLFGAAVAGIILLIRARKKYHLESGILPPPKENRVSSVFLNIGVAVCLAFFAFSYILSIWI